MTTSSNILSWRLIHDGTTVLDLFYSAGVTETLQNLFEATTKGECLAEISRLKLIYSPADNDDNKFILTSDFLQRFTPSERITIRNEAKTDIIIEDILYLMARSQYIVKSNPNTIQGMDYIKGKGLLSEERYLEIMDF